ncbi:MAG: tyrosine-type recombinase/integrase [Anaerolineales bacterium]|nr:tyrosine-type recombinase/integrase [Anaerolineales bacterium]
MSSDQPPAILAHITPHTPITPAVNAWRIYLDDQGKSPHTIKAFTADVLLLASYLPPDRPLGEITTQELNNFLDWMQKVRRAPCSPKTLARRITSIKAFFRWLHQYGVILADPAEKVPQQSVISPLPEVLTPDEVQAVLQAAHRHRLAKTPDFRYAVLLELLLATGIKKSECLALSPNHIDLDAPDGPILFVRYTSPQNRYKERKIALPETWTEIYAEYKSQYELDDRLFPWSPRRLEYLLEDLSEEAALDKHLSFDMCRWTCALSDMRSGIEHNKIRQKMGISKIQWREVKMKLERLAVD